MQSVPITGEPGSRIVRKNRPDGTSITLAQVASARAPAAWWSWAQLQRATARRAEAAP